ncbi:hypothetical protein Peur_052257 [Populus x canadensis]
MYLHSEELFFHPENSFVSILGCFYGYHFLTRRVKVQGKMLGQVHDLTLPIMDGTYTFWCVYFLHVNSLLIFFVSVYL